MAIGHDDSVAVIAGDLREVLRCFHEILPGYFNSGRFPQDRLSSGPDLRA